MEDESKPDALAPQPPSPPRPRHDSARLGLSAQPRGLLTGAFLNILGGAGHLAFGFLLTLVVGQLLGDAGLGIYFAAVAVAGILASIAGSGPRVATVRYVAHFLAERNPDRAKGTVRTALALSGAAALTLVILGLLFTEPGAATLLKGLDRPLSHQIWMLAVVSSLPMALTSILLASTRGTGRMGPSSLNEGLMVPLSRVLLFLVLFVVGLREVGALWAYLASAMVGLALAWWYARDAIATDPGTPKTWEWGTVVPFSLAQGGSGVLETGLFWADTLIIAALLTSGDVGVYGAAGRLALIPTMLLVAFNTVFQPWAASLWARGDREELERLYQQVTRLVTGGSVPFYLLLAAFPGPLLAVFGEEFRTGAIALVVLALGQIANVATGPAANLLSMAGYPSWNFWNNAALLVLNVAANLALVPRFGIIGAAIAWAGSVIVVNAARVVEVRHLTGLIPYDHHLLRISGLLLVGGAILLALRPWQIVSFGEAVLWGAPFVLAWMAAFVVLLPAEDRRLLRELLPIGRAR